jgi:2-dehydropantoate 2-reductase
VTGPHEPFEARPTALHVHEAQRLAADFDVAFVAMKAYDTAWATHMALPRLGPAGYVVSAQNCWNDPGVAAIAGQERSVGLVMSKIAVALWEPGHVERGAEKGSGSWHDVFRAGEHDGKITPRVEALARMLSVIDGAKATDNLWGERWSKLCSNAMGNPVQAMTGLGSLEIAGKPRGREITIRLGSESARVGLALGLTIPKIGIAEATVWAAATDDPAVFAELDAKLVPKEGAGRNWRASMAQDVAKGRRSEIEQMNGYVVARGREVGVPTPVSSAVVGIVREIDAGVRKQSPAHIEQALETARS